MERWHDLGTYCQETFGHKLFRVPLDGGFSCPNRDGTLNTGGCIFCDEGGSGDFAIHYDGSLLEEDDLSYTH
ncbi:MAG: TIGR01212 family radical SAM protein, partial [Erysipelotrichaceae bacterium]|nr:TIGR01212 family radical SAM protein [Erysipelotrichaceae bacterium]